MITRDEMVRIIMIYYKQAQKEDYLELIERLLYIVYLHELQHIYDEVNLKTYDKQQSSNS